MNKKYHTIHNEASRLVDAALSLIERLFSIIPVSVATKRPMVPLNRQTKTVTGLSKLWDGEPTDWVQGDDGLPGGAR